jgi:RNA polymerase sigma-70 factor (ECF subfamily)
MSNYTELSDNELYGLTVQDDHKAFTLLYDRYWKRMLYKALVKLQSDADAEEIVQDAFVDIWKSRHRIKIQHTFHTYIAAIVRYKIMAKMAANRKRLCDYLEDVQEMHVTDNSTEQWLGFNELRAEIENAVKALPQKCQLIFRMSREAGMCDRQISQDLDISQKTVEAHISRALKTLRISIHQFFIFLIFLIALITGT